jgi:hypothetical protein
MKRIGYTKDRDGKTITLIGAMADCGNVQKAYNKARKCKRYRKDVLIFTKDKEENLDRVRNDILGLAYEPSIVSFCAAILADVQRTAFYKQFSPAAR